MMTFHFFFTHFAEWMYFKKSVTELPKCFLDFSFIFCKKVIKNLGNRTVPLSQQDEVTF